MTEETMEKTFQVASPARLELANICGSVEVHAGEAGVIQVNAVKRTESGDAGRTEIEMTQASDGTVVVRTRFPEAGWTWLFGSHPCAVDYVVRAPRLCALRLRGVSNTLDVRGFAGECAVDMVSGEIELRDLNGDLRLRTVSGDISGERLSGKLEFKTVSGDLTLRESGLTSVQSNAVSGDVSLETGLAEGPYAFDSVSGDVRLTLPPATRCTAELAGISGDLSTAFPVSGYSHSSGRHSVTIWGGGVKVSLKSVSGDLSLESSGPLPAGSGQNPAASAEARRAVLGGVERGELSVEEALSKLKG
jgi:hypothetical protein